MCSGTRSVYVAIALSGLTALGAEVTWTRVMALLFGASVYTFSLILAVFLLGLGMGSSAGSYLVRHVRDDRTALGNCQVLLVISIAWSAYMIGSCTAVLACLSSACAEPMVQFPNRSVLLRSGCPAGGVLLGRQFSVCTRRSRSRHRRRTGNRRRLRSQYDRRDHRRTRIQHDCDPVGGRSASTTTADRPFGCRRPVDAGTVASLVAETLARTFRPNYLRRPLTRSPSSSFRSLRRC